MEITLIRHLPTKWNLQAKLQGKRDIPILPISEDVQEKIHHNLQLLEGKSFEHVLSSTLTRTRQTAQVYGFDTKSEPLLDELDFGPFEGRTKEELILQYGRLWSENPRELVLGESLLNLEKRIILFLEKYKEATNILAFGHGSWIRALSSYYQHGHINQMNQVTVLNNECISFEF
ncbi:phosphoglycerate mutase family protein [Robertmurraya yapensis]|uniref:Phosphoglycerate mutase family protein n=1 Tax=Bacillus yapensis TaxID=2492960 RepID=A0A431WKR4_9BACI|nr:phosphoglycerate mutase family protein [Bacillus yapensis]RTR35996.1 phosphoglycerate mutase family protein [Bacillus yapensis]TKT05499.1 phosphoglycerate mutase family protein [Bacillus yapensis]